MSPHQHTVLGLLAIILVLRVVASGRLAAAWNALQGGGTANAATTMPGGTGPPIPQGYVPQGGAQGLGPYTAVPYGPTLPGQVIEPVGTQKPSTGGGG